MSAVAVVVAVVVAGVVAGVEEVFFCEKDRRLLRDSKASVKLKEVRLGLM